MRAVTLITWMIIVTCKDVDDPNKGNCDNKNQCDKTNNSKNKSDWCD